MLVDNYKQWDTFYSIATTVTVMYYQSDMAGAE
jgi:hypothetical protein